MIPSLYYPELDLGLVRVETWGLLVATGFVVAAILAWFEAKRKELPAEKIIDLFFWLLLSAILGSRVFYVLNELPYFIAHPGEIIRLWEGGLMFYGGLAGGLVALLIFVKVNKINFWALAEVLAFSAPLGIAIGRVGCFLTHLHIGKPTNLPWALDYFGQGRHEASFYEIIANLLLFIIFLALRKKSLWPGFFTSFFFIYYGATRFLIDFSRATDLMDSDPHWWLLTPSQYLSLILFLVGAYLIFFKRKPRIV